MLETKLIQRIADALSRQAQGTLMAFSRLFYHVLDDIRVAINKDVVLHKIVNAVLAGEASDSEYTLQDGPLLYKGRILVPNEAALRSQLLREFHGSLTELTRLQGTELCMRSAYHPQTDGQTEALNRCLEMYLRCVASNEPERWANHLAWAEYWYNTASHSSTERRGKRERRTPKGLADYVLG
ncbi:hypothetical protein HRI_000777900 [Hibiscus trionum]|uniref:Integrase catalytic domain-containing protein n=1 Tax=Hibiscus trionum TaxID=183268 RepID=A0A9W7H5I0_HIBTR|nr:hypothetical protein HRI_000777900 [Hibiscus trionum]